MLSIALMTTFPKDASHTYLGGKGDSAKDVYAHPVTLLTLFGWGPENPKTQPSTQGDMA